MRRKLFLFLFCCAVAMIIGVGAFAQEKAAGGESIRWSVITAGFSMAIASAICGVAQSRAISAACEGVARNPGAVDAIRFFLILGLVLIESLALYTLLIVLKFTYLS